MKSRWVLLGLALLPPAASAADLHFRSRPLSGPLEDAVVGEVFFSPDSEWVVYWDGLSGSSGAGVYLARRWEGSVPVRLGVPQPSSGVTKLRFSPNSRRLLYLRSTNEFGELWELRSAGLETVAGGGARLGPVASGDSVLDYFVTPDGSRVVYRSWRAGGLGHELYTVAIDGSSAPVRLHPEQPALRGVEAFALSQDGQRVVFRADFADNENFGLWSAPVDGGGPLVRLSPPPIPGGLGVSELPGFELGGSQAFYVGEFAPGDGPELWRRPLDAATPAVRLSPAAVGVGDVTSLAVVPSSGRVLFTGRLLDDVIADLFSVPWGGAAPAASRLNPESSVSPQPLRWYQATADGSRVLFTGTYSTAGIVDLYSVPIGGPAADLVQLSLPTPEPEDPTSGLPFVANSADGQLVVYAGPFSDPPGGIWSVAASGPAASSVRLDSDTAGWGVATSFAAADSRFLYLASRETPNENGPVTELWSTPVDASTPAVRLHAELTAQPQRVFDALEGGGDLVYFVGALTNDPGYPREVWVNTAVNPALEPVRLHPPASGGWYLPSPTLAPDGLGALFLVNVLADSEFRYWLADSVVFRADFDEEGDTSEWSLTTP